MEESRANLYCHREAAAWAPKPRELPVTLVTGFLGAGKTSLLRHILSNKSNLRVAAAVNDFAAVNLDAQLVARSRGSEDAQVVELSNGCVCCSSAAAAGFSEAVAQVLQECDVGKVQYLVVETSGVADPAGLIATLDQEFGRLFRVRLDSVVTVVDADVLHTELADASASDGAGSGSAAAPRQYIAAQSPSGEPTFSSTVAESQLRCADVVLLNKVDLLERAEADAPAAVGALCAWVEGVVGAGVRVYPCKQCAVPLDAIMEVTQSNLYDESTKGVHTHERTASNYVVLDSRGVRRVGSTRAPSAPATSAALLPALAARGPALATDYAVRVFESTVGLRLAAFQDFLAEAFIRCRLLRVKGGLSFAEDCAAAGGAMSGVFFHASGRQRFELSEDGGARAADSQLVLIGVGQEAVDRAHDELGAAAAAAPSEDATVEATREAVQRLISAHDLFAVCDDAAAQGQCAVFRLTAVQRSGLSIAELRERHHVDLDRVNAQLLAAVNSSPGPAFLTALKLPGEGREELWLRHALGGAVSIGSWWQGVEREAEAVVGRNAAMQAALGAGVSCPKGEASLHMQARSARES